MWRRLLRFAVGVSAVLCVAIVGLCLWSSQASASAGHAGSVHLNYGKTWLEAGGRDSSLYFMRISGFGIIDNGASAKYRLTLTDHDEVYNVITDNSLLRLVVLKGMWSEDGVSTFPGGEWNTGYIRPGPFRPLAQLPTFQLLQLHWWLAAGIFGLAPLLRAAGVARRRILCARALSRGLCPTCGYDLRASAGICPECGATAA